MQGHVLFLLFRFKNKSNVIRISVVNIDYLINGDNKFTDEYYYVLILNFKKCSLLYKYIALNNFFTPELW